MESDQAHTMTAHHRSEEGCSDHLVDSAECNTMYCDISGGKRRQKPSTIIWDDVVEILRDQYCGFSQSHGHRHPIILVTDLGEFSKQCEHRDRETSGVHGLPTLITPLTHWYQPPYQNS